MKLFTKEINNKLFKQFPLGNDLEKQVVVAKIFNPYGRGKWYLINSDPSDPDYIWAIVDNYEVEIGSVSRRDLENLRITAFGWPLERDIYFSPMNAAEVFRGLRSGKRYATGGNVSMDESVQMVSSQAKEAKHHANELSQAIKGQTHIEPWVVAKMERASTDLSDVTHYLDGKTEYGKGGEVKERIYIEYLNKKNNFQRDIKYFDSYEAARNWALKNFDKFNPDMIKYEYAKGGGVERVTQAEFLNQDFEAGKNEIIEIHGRKKAKRGREYLLLHKLSSDRWGISTYNPKSKKEIDFESFNDESQARFWFDKINDSYENGGMATFDDKVKAISKRLEGTKVKGKYKKEYGATYDKKESKQAATKIAGKMRARERAKEILNKRKKK